MAGSGDPGTANAVMVVGNAELAASRTDIRETSVRAIGLFLAWLEQTRLPVPLTVTEIREDGVAFTFEGWTCLRGLMQPTGISIRVYEDEDDWDSIVDFAIRPVQRNGRWVCGYWLDACQEGGHGEPPSHASELELWTSHVFTSFWVWTHEKFKRATGVGFWDHGDVQEARLVYGDDDVVGAIKVIKRSALRPDE